MILSDKQRKILEEANLPLLLLLEAEELNSDDEPDASKASDAIQNNQAASQADNDNANANAAAQDDQDDQDDQDPPDEEKIFTYELEGTEDKFLQFTLYDKLSNLSGKIEILLDNIKNDTNAENLDLLANLEHYSQYLSVLNELIFSISTSVVYKLVGQIELELIDLLEVYNANLEKKMLNDKIKG